jgi:hypothetical protein
VHKLQQAGRINSTSSHCSIIQKEDTNLGKKIHQSEKRKGNMYFPIRLKNSCDRGGYRGPLAIETQTEKKNT